jgi:hypothetical protein
VGSRQEAAHRTRTEQSEEGILEKNNQSIFGVSQTLLRTGGEMHGDGKSMVLDDGSNNDNFDKIIAQLIISDNSIHNNNQNNS